MYEWVFWFAGLGLGLRALGFRVSLYVLHETPLRCVYLLTQRPPKKPCREPFSCSLKGSYKITIGAPIMRRF